MGRGLEEMPGEGRLGKGHSFPHPSSEHLSITAPSPAVRAQWREQQSPEPAPDWRNLPCHMARPDSPAPLPTSTTRVLPGSYWDTAGRELGGHLTNPLLYRGGIEAQGGDACLTGAQQTRDSQAPTLLGTFRNIQHILTHSHDARKPAAH